VDDRDIKRIGIVAGVGLVVFLILSQAYQAGVATGLARDGDGRGIDGPGFFPFPPFLLLIGGAVLFVVWRRRWAGDGSDGHGRGPGGRPPRIFEEWHRRAHESEAQQPPASVSGAGTSAGGTTATANAGGQPVATPGGGSAENGPV